MPIKLHLWPLTITSQYFQVSQKASLLLMFSNHQELKKPLAQGSRDQLASEWPVFQVFFSI